MTRNENLEAIIDVPRSGLGPFPLEVLQHYFEDVSSQIMYD